MIRYTIACICCICLFITLVNAQVSQQDSLALVALYNATDGDNWTDNTNWLDGPVSTWYGVTVGGERVTILLLQNNNLVGEIPDEIGDLTAVKSIRLYSNSLTGEIPTSIGNCESLEYLDIHVNELSGTIPDEMAQCSSLVTIVCYRNAFSGPFPEVLLRIPQIQRFDISSNAFSGQLPPAIDTMVNLRSLNIHGNDFSGPMPSITHLDALSQLHLSSTAMEGMIDTILGYHPELSYCTFNNTNFSGCVSETHFNPEELTYLHFTNSDISCMGDFSAFADTGVLRRLLCRGNTIPFEYLEPNIAVNEYGYYPQDSLLAPEAYVLAAGDTIEIYSGTGGMHTSYTWYKDGEALAGKNEPWLEIPDFQEADAGAYYCAATNDSLPELTLYRHQVRLTLDETSAITGVTSAKHLAIYPNPASDAVIFKGMNGPGEVHILDMYGRELTQQTTDLSQRFDVRSLPTGCYVVYIDIGSDIFSGLLLKL